MTHIPDILCALVILRPVTLQLERHCYRKAPRSTPRQEVTTTEKKFKSESTGENLEVESDLSKWFFVTRRLRQWFCYSKAWDVGPLWCFFQTRQHTVQLAPPATTTTTTRRRHAVSYFFTDGPSPSWLALSDSFVAHPALQPKWSSTNQILLSYKCNIIIVICR